MINLTDPIKSKNDYFHAEQGNNRIRLASLAAEDGKGHWSQKLNRTLACAGPGCPVCIKGDVPFDLYTLKIIDRRSETVKAWEIRRGMRKNIAALIATFDEGEDAWLDSAILDQNLVLVRGNGKPRETLTLAGAVSPEQEKADAALVAASTLVLADCKRKVNMEDLRKAAE